MKRPNDIYMILEKVSSGTFLNEKEFNELHAYIAGLEKQCASMPNSESAKNVIENSIPVKK